MHTLASLHSTVYGLTGLKHSLEGQVLFYRFQLFPVVGQAHAVFWFRVMTSLRLRGRHFGM